MQVQIIRHDAFALTRDVDAISRRVCCDRDDTKIRESEPTASLPYRPDIWADANFRRFGVFETESSAQNFGDGFRWMGHQAGELQKAQFVSSWGILRGRQKGGCI